MRSKPRTPAPSKVLPVLEFIQRVLANRLHHMGLADAATATHGAKRFDQWVSIEMATRSVRLCLKSDHATVAAVQALATDRTRYSDAVKAAGKALASTYESVEAFVAEWVDFLAVDHLERDPSVTAYLVAEIGGTL